MNISIAIIIKEYIFYFFCFGYVTCKMFSFNVLYRSAILFEVFSFHWNVGKLSKNGCSAVLCLVTHWCPTLCDPTDCSTPGFPVLHYLPGFAQTHAHESVMPSNHLILCHPLPLLPSIFPSIRVFSKESALPMRCSKYWGFRLSPSNEYSGLIYSRTDWFLKEINPKEYFVIDPKELWKDSAHIYHAPLSASWRRKWQPTPVSCLENPMDRGAWWAVVYGVTRVRQDWVTKPPPLSA